ncbi:MAG: hypothetical protein VZR73_10660 [Acutalibacteraceae bacterium]|nr:hypothetical protein [Acutalibacteraceae bacterium]
MVDSLTLYDTMDKKVRMIDISGKVYEGEVGLYESEWDSESGEAEIGLCGTVFTQSEIESIEIID